jgi:succinoglycan biosynthesis protein ExoM
MRPNLLARSLESVRKQKLSRFPQTEVCVCVVDNDAAGSARGVVERERRAMTWPLTYAIEPNRGISYARNRLIELSKGADFVAFLDDDEIAESDWLDALLAVQLGTGGDVILGAVSMAFQGNPPPYLRDAHEGRGGHPDGKEIGMDAFGAGNLLVRLSVLGDDCMPFDPAFALTGGEDVCFGYSLRSRGVKFYYAAGALVHEVVTQDRATLRWLLMRSYRIGCTRALIDRRMEPWIGPWKRLFKGFGGILVGVVSFLPSAVRGRRGAVRCICRISKGVGSLAGLAGLRYYEYRRASDL